MTVRVVWAFAEQIIRTDLARKSIDAVYGCWVGLQVHTPDVPTGELELAGHALRSPLSHVSPAGHRAQAVPLAP